MVADSLKLLWFILFQSKLVQHQLQKKLPSVEQVPEPRFGEVFPDPWSLRLSTAINHIARSLVVHGTLGYDRVKKSNVRGIQVSVVDYK